MPKVKTITPGRLSGLSTLTSELASDISQQKEREYLKAVSDWEEEKAKLDAIKEDQLNYIDQKMQLIAGIDQFAGEKFDDTFKNDWMNSVKDYASIVSDIKLGNIDAAEGYMKLAKYDKKLTDLQTFIPNFNTFATKVQDGFDKREGEVGSFIHDGDQKTWEIVQIVNDLYHPTRNSNVSYQTIDGQDFLVHKNGQKISIPGLNAIMSGNNPDYPISFAESPDEALGQLYDAMWKRNGNGATYLVDVKEESYNKKGGITTTTTKKYNIADGSKFSNDLKETVAPMIDDQDKMRVIWNNIGGDGKWENTEDQRSQAITLLHNRAKDLYAPTSNVTNVDIKLPRPSKDKDKKDGITTTTTTAVDYSDLYNANKLFMDAVKNAPPRTDVSPFYSFETEAKISQAKDALKDFAESISGKRRIRHKGKTYTIDKLEVDLIDEDNPALGYQFTPFIISGDEYTQVAGPFRIQEEEDLQSFENLLIPLGRSITVGTKSNKSPNNDNLPTLTMEQAKKGKKGDQFILKSNGKKYTLVEDQNGNLFGTTTPEKYI